MICQYCDKHLEGRSNRRYHDECKKRAERDRDKLRRLLKGIVDHERQENEALRDGLYEAVRYARARKERAQIEISLLGFKLKLTGDPKRFVEWLMRKEKRTFSEQAALDDYHRNSTGVKNFIHARWWQ